LLVIVFLKYPGELELRASAVIRDANTKIPKIKARIATIVPTIDFSHIFQLFDIQEKNIFTQPRITI
jgi:hypothetical protein